MRVFVVGATGFIGTHVSRALVERGNFVSGLARSSAAVDRLRAAGVEPVASEICGAPALDAAQAADAVIFTPQLSQEDEQSTVHRYLEGAARTSQAFIFMSGAGVFARRTGGYWSEESFSEHDPFEPMRQLVTRTQTEQAVIAAAPGARTMVVRPPAIVGYGHHWHEQIIRKAVKHLGAACYIDLGLNITTTVHVDDLVELIDLLLKSGKAGNVYHASACEYNARALAEVIAAECGCGTRSLTMDEAVEKLGRFETLMVLGVNSRSRSPNSRSLGWTPKKLDLLDEVRGRGAQPAPADSRAF